MAVGGLRAAVRGDTEVHDEGELRHVVCGGKLVESLAELAVLHEALAYVDLAVLSVHESRTVGVSVPHVLDGLVVRHGDTFGFGCDNAHK